MSSAPLYDTIGATYTVTRRTEPRIAARIWAALGDARTILNVGAGTGSYEPPGRDVTAMEPSALMRAQRPAGAAPCVAATAESLPFEDQSFDAAMALATIDHWQDPIAGLREMRRVARRVVVFTCDASDPDRFWLNRDYLPEYASLWADRPSLTGLALPPGDPRCHQHRGHPEGRGEGEDARKRLDRRRKSREDDPGGGQRQRPAQRVRY